MTLPKSNIWQGLRAEALSAIPHGTPLHFGQPATVAAWQRAGYFTVLNVQGKTFTLAASTVDVAAALLGDAELYLDHAAEQQVSTLRALQVEPWTSPAWVTVTFYYWGYFLIVALTRLLGRSAWWLDDDMVRLLLQIAPRQAKNPGSGTYLARCGPVVSATDREFTLSKGKGRAHDTIWKLWFSICNEYLKLYRGKTDPEEERLFSAMSLSAKQLGDDWPSEFRNAVNYRAGFGYDVVRRDGKLGTFRFVRHEPYSTLDLIDNFENAVLASSDPRYMTDKPNLVTRVLVGTVFVLQLIVRELYSELVDRHRLDSRWQRKRESFLSEHGLLPDGRIWPA